MRGEWDDVDAPLRCSLQVELTSPPFVHALVRDETFLSALLTWPALPTLAPSPAILVHVRKPWIEPLFLLQRHRGPILPPQTKRELQQLRGFFSSRFFCCLVLKILFRCVQRLRLVERRNTELFLRLYPYKGKRKWSGKIFRKTNAKNFQLLIYFPFYYFILCFSWGLPALSSFFYPNFFLISSLFLLHLKFLNS